MKTENIMAILDNSNFSSTQNKGVPFFSCLGHEFSITCLYLGKVKVFVIILACQS